MCGGHCCWFGRGIVGVSASMVEVSKSLLRFGCSISERCSELERLALCTVAISGVASGRGSSVRRGCGGGDLCASLGVS